MPNFQMLLSALALKSFAQSKNTKAVIYKLQDEIKNSLDLINDSQESVNSLGKRYDELKKQLDIILQVNDKIQQANLDEMQSLRDIWSLDIE